MSYAAIDEGVLQQTGARAPARGAHIAGLGAWTIWRDLWSEVFRAQAMGEPPQTTTVAIFYVIEALPVIAFAGATRKMLTAMESVFGDSVSDIARILRVSRPMIYHYREGMEPSVETKRRLQMFAEQASLVGLPLKGLLKAKQPEGQTLLEFLSDERLDIGALRRVLRRNVPMAEADQILREKLARALTQGETAEERRDIVRERHAAGKPVYVGDPDAPGKVMQILPDGNRIRGRMIKRKFVPDEE